MPARNEEKTIERNVGVLKKALEEESIHHAVLVIDGPTDSTRDRIFDSLNLNLKQRLILRGRNRSTVVLPGGFILVHHPKPEGKGRAFMEAVLTLKGRTRHFDHPDSVLVNIDADCLDLDPLYHLVDFARELRRRNAPMLLGRHEERHGRAFFGAGPDSTGYRAMSARSLQPMLEFDERWVKVLASGMALDKALNHLIFGRKDKQLTSIALKHLEPYRHVNSADEAADFKGTGGRAEAFLQESVLPSSLKFDPAEVAFRERAERLLFGTGKKK